MDVITNGTTQIGTVIGWYEEEHLSYDYRFSSSSIIRIEEIDGSSIIKLLRFQLLSAYLGKHYVIKMPFAMQSQFKNHGQTRWLEV